MLKPKSLQDILKLRQQTGFVGREEQVSLFRKNLALPLEEDNRRFIFNVWGQGGVGKSTLLRQFRKIAEEAEIICAYTDETQRGVPETMGRLGVIEVWFWENNKLKLYHKREDIPSKFLETNGYEQVNTSELLLDLNISLLEECTLISDHILAIDEFEQGI